MRSVLGSPFSSCRKYAGSIASLLIAYGFRLLYAWPPLCLPPRILCFILNAIYSGGQFNSFGLLIPYSVLNISYGRSGIGAERPILFPIHNRIDAWKAARWLSKWKCSTYNLHMFFNQSMNAITHCVRSRLGVKHPMAAAFVENNVHHPETTVAIVDRYCIHSTIFRRHGCIQGLCRCRENVSF